MSEALQSNEPKQASWKRRVAAVAAAGGLVLGLSSCSVDVDSKVDGEEVVDDTQAVFKEAWEDIIDVFTHEGDDNNDRVEVDHKLIVGFRCAPKQTVDVLEATQTDDTAHIKVACSKDGKNYRPQDLNQIAGRGIIIEDDQKPTHEVRITFDGNEDSQVSYSTDNDNDYASINLRNVDELKRVSTGPYDK